MHAEIVMIGTELLLGELLDTNANRLAKAIHEIGKRHVCAHNVLKK